VVGVSEWHVTHLLSAERGLLAEYYQRQVYLALCGAELPVSEVRQRQANAPGSGAEEQD
jgi:hypothetical protein